MASIEKKIDFALVFTVTNANPNGDPLNGNIPRVTLDGYGELSDVCLKRKIRNRLQDAGNKIFVQSDDYRVDEYRSLKQRADAVLGDAMKDEQKLAQKACETWIDVRSFGQVFAFKGKDTSGVSVGIRGPVTIQSAFSINPVSITSSQITKSVSGEGDGSKKGSDTMGMKHRVDFGLYKTCGSINPQLAERTGFSAEDAEKIKKALFHIFDNDASSARPEGSMEVVELLWWEHSCKSGDYSSAKVHRSLKITQKKEIENPKTADDFDIVVEPLEGLAPEILK
jgi:CRISPR-associated protein Csd2